MAILMQDTFTNTNGTSLTSHISDSGHTWIGNTAGYEIRDNTAYTLNTARQYVEFDAGTPNKRYVITLDGTSQTASYLRIKFRDDGADNYWWIVWMGSNNWDLRKNGTETGVVGSVTIQNSSIINSTTTIEVICDGDAITVYIMGQLAFSLNDSYNSTTGTKVGFVGWSAGHKFDDVLIESLGTEEPPTGTDVSYTFDTSNIIYADRSINTDTKQAIYKDTNINLDTSQRIYADVSYNHDTRQLLYQSVVSTHDLKQSLYEDITTLFDTMQEIYSDYVQRSYTFDMQTLIYADRVAEFVTRQEMYRDITETLDTKQMLYRVEQSGNDLNLIIYADVEVHTDSLQQFYEDIGVQFDTKQVLYDESGAIIGTIELEGKRQLNIYLQGKRELNVQLEGKRELNVHLKGLIE